MLTDIHIKDFNTIHDLQLHFPAQLIAFTGETGSGKSIFIQAIELVLGGRGSSDSIRHGKERTDISLSFDISNYPHVQEQLHALDLHTEHNDCFLRRVITHHGKSKCYVNGVPVTVQLMRELGDELFHLHSQHEQQILFKSDTQRRMLDQFADTTELAKIVQQLKDEWQIQDERVRTVLQDIAQREQKSLFLQHQLNELEPLHLVQNEWEELERTHKIAATQTQSVSELNEMLHFFQREDAPNVFSILHELRKKMEHVHLSTSSSWLERMENLIQELRDLEADIQTVIDHTEKDPDAFERIENRMGSIFSVARKYKIQPTHLYEFIFALKQERNALEASDEQLIEWESKREQTLEMYRQHAQTLHKKRAEAAVLLATQVNETIAQLALPHALFVIECESDETLISPHGFDKIQFLMRTHLDSPVLPIAKALSGGELSRLSLALHLALAHRTTIPTLIFDEVDTGIGGATAEKVGKLLRILGNSHQVFTITHQPQVAVQATHHVRVHKHYDSELGTRTELHFLNKEERINEIARMLGGETITDTTRSHAEEIVNGV